MLTERASLMIHSDKAQAEADERLLKLFVGHAGNLFSCRLVIPHRAIGVGVLGGRADWLLHNIVPLGCEAPFYCSVTQRLVDVICRTGGRYVHRANAVAASRVAVAVTLKRSGIVVSWVGLCNQGLRNLP